MTDILIPPATAERRQAAHLVDDGRWSLCGQHAALPDEERVPDTDANRQRVRAAKRHICGLCDNIKDGRARVAEREAQRQAQPKPPTKREREAAKLARWNAAAKLAAQT